MKTYTVHTTCPDCGTQQEQTHTAQDMEQRYGSGDNVTATCPQCIKEYENEMRTACLEWDDVCQMQTSRRG
ncbi:hypothetical protein [Desulfonatronum thioautotrophicum]|uniref:hypothetical protein n=1 Tax=Desulfonatronum thioautotrophicum TaxID=617001 RepID=UPI0005EB2C11|nr:hypothetical protein [Desulfonatronum thioautotrophicum]